MATGVPQYRRLAVRGVLQGAVPALLPENPEGEVFLVGGGGACAAPATDRYDTVTVPVRHGLETVDILRLRRACGAVQQTAGGSAIAFLVPPGTAQTWHLPGSSCTAGAVLLPLNHPRWVMPPAGPQSLARATDAWVLRSALCEAACTLTAGGLGPF